MNDERWQQIDEILQAAFDLEPHERPAFLDEACAGDDELRREVESLLAHEDSAEYFIETSAMKIVARDFTEEDLSGQQIGHYRIIKPIGAGGMGKVYLAEDKKLKRQVAIKFLPETVNADADHVRRFEQEAHAVSALNHPNIITIHEVGQIEGKHFIVTELVEGATLRQQMAKSKLTVKETIEIAAQVVSALKAAHRAGIFHRDIKPENLMLREDGLVKVLDFGIAKLGGEGEIEGKWDGEIESSPQSPRLSVPPSAFTIPGAVMGTASYMSPEQARGDEVDGRTDLFSLGAVMYEMVMGERLFTGATPAEVTEQLLRPQEPLHSAVKFGGKIKQLEPVIRKCLRRKREERYGSADELLGELQRLKRQIETRFIRRVTISVSLVALLAVAAFGWIVPASINEEWIETRMRDGHTAAVRRAVFSPDGRLLVSVGEDKQVIVWDFAQRRRLKTFTDHTDWVSSVAFSPDGKLFATGSYDKTVIVWNVARLEKEIVLREHRDQVNAVAFSPDGKFLATASAPEFQKDIPDNRTVLWNTSRWEKARELPQGSGGGNLLFSPNSRSLMVPGGQWDVNTGQKISDWGTVNWAEHSPNAKQFVVNDTGGSTNFLSVAQPDELR
ncbi:MAG: WD40 repeat domain-containing serine/threonine protein kinase, partial [Blastocatellia bacterium]